MKARSIFYSSFFTIVVFSLLPNCSGGKKAESDDTQAHAAEEKTSEAAAPQFVVSENFQQQLGKVFTSYISLKDAFVASDAEKVKAEASTASHAVAAVDMKLLSGAAHNDWMSYLAPIQASLKEIENTSDIEAQRKAFSTLSENLYKSIKAFGLGGADVFYDYCPMAFNNEGAYWLSDQTAIRNPYFGDAMLTCGVVKETLQ
jgi:Cu(I)/Ag(I) efflux system membrane fusion protein